MSEQPPRRLSPLTPVVRSFIIVVAAASTIGRDMLNSDMGPAGITVGVLLVGGAVYGIASWVRTKFWIESDVLRVDTGVLNRQSRRIRIDRLQGIDIVQPFVARLFGLAELRMDVAGGNAREGSLAFLPLADAHLLKDLLLARRDAVRSSTARDTDPDTAQGMADGEEGTTDAAARPVQVPALAPEKVIARVDHTTLLLSIIASPETFAFMVLALLFPVASLFTGEWSGFSGALPVLAGLGIVLFRRFSSNYNFTVSETAAGLQVRRGLFDLNSQTIALPRLQGIVITEPALWRHFGWARLDVSIAGYETSASDSNGPSASVALPVGDRALAMHLARHVLGGVDPDDIALTPPADAARWAAPIARRFMRAGAGIHLVVTREGWLTRRTHVVPHARIQSLRLVQGPWQRRLGLADLEIDSPPGPVRARARHRPAPEARRAMEVEAEVSRKARQAMDHRAG